MLPIKTIDGKHWSGRQGQRPRYLVLHSAANSAAATTDKVAAYLANNAVKSSAHYLVGPDVIYAIVPEYVAAHHAGGSTLPDGTVGTLREGTAIVDAVNASTIGVEMMQTVGQPVRAPVLDAAIPLLVDICRRNKIPAANVVSHASISVHAPQGAHSDPVGVDMAIVRARVAAGLGETSAPPLRPSKVNLAKVAWFAEDVERRMKQEGLVAEAAYWSATYTADAIRKRDS